MGRHAKAVISDSGFDRRELGYYATPAFVAEFLGKTILEQNPNGTRTLDPCVGQGELIEPFLSAGTRVDGIDIQEFEHTRLSSFSQADFLSVFEAHLNNKDVTYLPHDYLVANPPYNCHESTFIQDHKNRLKALFPEVGVLNMYSMFLSAMIRMAKPGAIIGVITLDSFLTARFHRGLRKQILDECTVHHLLLCPRNLFRSQGADVRTCILILEKGIRKEVLTQTLNRPDSTHSFQAALNSRAFTNHSMDELVLQSERDAGEWVIGVPDALRRLFRCPRIGDQFKCVTGISTGNNARFLRPRKCAEFSVPFYKNPASQRFYAPPDGWLPGNFMALAKQTPNFLVRNKELLFQEGISCSSMGHQFGACRLPAGATFGVNANIFCSSTHEQWWLLAYLNSSLVTCLVRAVLLRGNMITSGYVARLPLAPLTAEDKSELARLAKFAWKAQAQGHSVDMKEIIQQIDSLIFRRMNWAGSTTAWIQDFADNLLKRT